MEMTTVDLDPDVNVLQMLINHKLNNIRNAILIKIPAGLCGSGVGVRNYLPITDNRMFGWISVQVLEAGSIGQDVSESQDIRRLLCLCTEQLC